MYNYTMMTISMYIGNGIQVIAWMIFSFLFWRRLRRWGVEDDRIFDLTFYGALSTLVGARLYYVFTHWPLFAGKSLLYVFALWVSPGLTWLGGMIAGTGMLVVLGRIYKIRIGWILDALALSFPIPLIVGELASFIHAYEIGRHSGLPWAIRYIRVDGMRHPVQLYTLIVMACIGGILIRLNILFEKKKIPYGLLGVWFFLLYSVSSFLLEFFKIAPVYLKGLSANQWILIGVFAECIGVLYIRGGGRENGKRTIQAVQTFFYKKGKALYATISKRDAQ